MNPRPRFNERKATQVAARFLKYRKLQRLNYMALLKLMYLADRQALLRWGSPITNDRYYALDWGPILSRAKDLAADRNPEPSLWSQHISAPENYFVRLMIDAGDDELSRAEERLIDEIQQKYGHLSQWELVEVTHALPEWQDPKGSAIPIEIEDILAAAGIDEDDREDILHELKGLRRMQALAD